MTLKIDMHEYSDFEINCAVHNAMMEEPYKIEFLGQDKIRWVKGDTDITTDKVAYKKNTLKDYCNNPTDAWPIIESIFWTLLLADKYGTTVWGRHMRSDDDSDRLRAAMIVFLKLKDNKDV